MNPLSAEPAAAAGSGTARLRLEPGERRAVGGLAAVYGIRMLGLFLMLPVLALYGRGLPGGTPALAGLAVGAYGLTQALLQVPFGIWSDRIGRRPVIVAGLVLYALGSVVGGLAHNIWAVIAARMVQGAGAVSGPVTALLADLTRPEVRTRAMALIGISIGGSFIVSLVAAPILTALIGVPGLFFAIGGLAALSLALIILVVPAGAGGPQPAASSGRLAAALRADLVPYYLGILILTAVLSATFVGVPFALHDELGIAVRDHWRTYLGVFLASVPLTIPLILLSERSGAPDTVMRLAIALLMLSLAALSILHAHYWPMSAALAGFFTAFNYLEARLPARLSQVVGPDMRGAALSVFATAQFLGSFAGAVAAGWIAGRPVGLVGVFGSASLAVLLWQLIARRSTT